MRGGPRTCVMPHYANHDIIIYIKYKYHPINSEFRRRKPHKPGDNKPNVFRWYGCCRGSNSGQAGAQDKTVIISICIRFFFSRSLSFATLAIFLADRFMPRATILKSAASSS